MKKITQFSVNYPVTVLMIVMAILLLGYISFSKLGIDLFPDMNNPKIFIELIAGEKPPEEIEKKFVDRIESAVMRQKGVVEVSSVSKVGGALITLEYVWETDMDDAFLELQKAMVAYSQNSEIEELNISRHDPNSSPVMLIGMWHNSIDDMNELRKSAENYIRNELIRIEGIADVKIAGQEESEVLIEVNQYLLSAYGITTDNISSQLDNYNRNVSGGSITELGRKYIIKGMSIFQDIEDIRNLIITYKTEKDAISGTTKKVPVQLKDIAEVRFQNADPNNIVRLNQKRCLGLSIYKETKYNTVKVVDKLSEKLEDIQNALPGYNFEVVENQGKFINSAINEVKESALYGILLAVFVLYLFLRRIGTTIIISVAIPISIVATFNLMYFNGLTLNIMTLGGLALGAGMLVDNAIVVMENIFRNLEQGKSIREAAIEGTAQVGGAITASTITTIVVFLPIVYLHGASGELFKDQAWTVAFSLFSSLFVALLVIPVFVTKVFKKPSSVETTEMNSVKFNRYGIFLRAIIEKRWTVILVAVFLIAGAIYLVPIIGSEYFPKSESNNFTIEIVLPEGTQLERTTGTVENIENIVKAVIKEDINVLYSHIGPSISGESTEEDFFEDENTANVKVILKPSAISRINGYISSIQNIVKNINGPEFNFIREESSLKEILGNEEAPVIVEIKGPELDDIEIIADSVKRKLLSINDLNQVESSAEGGAPEIEVVIDRYRAALYNLTVNSISNSIKEQLSGKEAGEFDHSGELKNIMIKSPELSLSEFRNMFIKSQNTNIPLQEIAAINYTTSPKEIKRRNQSRIVNVTAEINSDKSFDKIIKEINTKIQQIELPANYSIEITGQEQKRKESFGNLSFALILSVILVYMVLASQFESLIHPFTILLTIPLAGVGSILIFLFMGNSLNVMAYIGIIMLAGIAVNDSIILVDAINQNKQRGLSRIDAIVDAGQQRIRPIIMTTLTTILALLPLTLGFGESAALRAPLALAVIGGLVTSTLLTLIVIPCVYYVFDGIIKINNQIAVRK